MYVLRDLTVLETHSIAIFNKGLDYINTVSGTTFALCADIHEVVDLHPHTVALLVYSESPNTFISCHVTIWVDGSGAHGSYTSATWAFVVIIYNIDYTSFYVLGYSCGAVIVEPQHPFILVPHIIQTMRLSFRPCVLYFCGALVT